LQQYVDQLRAGSGKKYERASLRSQGGKWMEWQVLKNGFTMAKVELNESIDEALTEFCQHIKQHVIPKNDGVSWDCLRIELWADSGRIIAFPSSTSNPDRIEKAGCQVVFADLLAQYEHLADSELDDDAFATALLSVERDWIKKTLVAAKRVSLTGNRLQFWGGEGEHPICENQL